MVIRAVLFDWDGTLVRHGAVPAATPSAVVASYARQQLGLAVSDQDFERAFQAVLPAFESGKTETSPHIDGLLGSAFGWLGWTVGSDEVGSCARLFCQEALAGLTVYDDARALIPSLKYRGYRLGVVTNAIFPGRLFHHTVNELGLSGYLDAFVSSADIGFAKPNPAIYHHALRAIGAEAHETLFVGDRIETDIAGALAAGISPVHIQRSAQASGGAGYPVLERLSGLNNLLGEHVI